MERNFVGELEVISTFDEDTLHITQTDHLRQFMVTEGIVHVEGGEEDCSKSYIVIATTDGIRTFLAGRYAEIPGRSMFDGSLHGSNDKGEYSSKQGEFPRHYLKYKLNTRKHLIRAVVLPIFS